MQTAKKLIVAIAIAGVACCALGEDYTWTGEANDGGLWTTPQNWGRESGYPSGSDAVINFDGNATVSLNTGTETPIKVIKVNDGVVTINGTAGSYLKATNATAGYDELFAVAANAVQPEIQLIVNVPVDAGGLRCDKWNGGALVFRSAFTNMMNNTGGIGFLFGSGSNVLENACDFYTPNCNVVLANGPAGSGTLYLRITDGAHLTANLLRTPSRSSNGQYVDIIQEDSDTVVSIRSDIELGYNTGSSSRWSRYMLEGGRLYVGRDIICGIKSTGIFEMSGGTLELGGSFKTNGVAGRFVYSGGKILVSADRVGNPIPEWAELNAEPLIGAVAGATLSLDSWDCPYPIRKVGDGTMLFPDDASMTITNDVFVNEGTFKFGSRIHLNAPPGDYTPWKIKVANGAKLRFTDLTSRLSRPLDLEIEEGGELHMPNAGTGDNGIYMRSMLIAHKLKVGGQVFGRGTRYGISQYFTGQAGASIAVPFVWTGAAGDGIWETAGNWEDNQLPTGGNTSTIVDLSRADGQTIKITNAAGYCIGGVIANPNGATRRVTITGGGLALQNGVSYNCAIYVGEGCELVFDCDYYQSSGAHAIVSTALGGGKITFLRNYADLGHQNVAAPLMADATLVFAGTNMTMRGGTGWKYFLPGGSIEKEGRGRAVIEEGAYITATRFQCARISTSVMDEIVQRGGTLTVEDFVLGRMNSNWPSHWRQEYRFENGEITCSTGFHLGEYMENSDGGYRYTGGTFMMTGGTLTTPLVKTAANTQFLRFYGGTFNLGGGGMVLDTSTDHYSSHVINPDPVRLGGVKIRATADSVSDVPLVLDGTNGDPEIDTDGHDMTFEGKVLGSGGLVKSGLGSAIFAGECTFGGRVTVKGGSLVFGEFSSLHGGTIVVESGGTLAINGAVDAPLSLSLPTEQALTLPASASITVAALSVGGVQRAVGSYGIGGGTVIVAPPAPGAGDAVWIGPSGGQWNNVSNWKDGVIPNGDTVAVDFGFASIASNTTINLDADTVLKTLIFTHPEEGAKLTIGAAGGVLKIVSAATITVQQGRTLEIAADVVMGPRESGNTGIIKVNGGGVLRFTGKVTPESPISTLGSYQAPWMEMSGGTVDIAGEIEGVRIMTASTNILPRLVFSEGMVATNKFAPTVAWGTSSSSRIFAEIVQNGGTFGLDTLNPSLFTTKFNLGYLGGGLLTYTINNGLFRMNRQYPTYFNYYDAEHTVNYSGRFLFTVNGGEVDFCNYVFGGMNKGDQETLVLNEGGTLRFLNGFDVSAGLGTLVLNGGRIESAFTGTLLADSVTTLVELNGNVCFAQNGAGEQITVASAVSGDGTGSVEQLGPGELVFNAVPGIGSATVTGGTLSFAGMTTCTNCVVGAGTTLRLAYAESLQPGAVVSIAGDGALDLDFDEGMLVLGRLTIGSRVIKHGDYGAGTGRSLPAGINGDCALRVLHGSGGIVMSFR